MPITHVIFDLDGLILDTEKASDVAMSQTLVSYGKSYNDDLQRIMRGSVLEIGVAKMLKVSGLSGVVTVEEYVDKYHVYVEESFKKVDILPGIEKMVDYFYGNGIPMAICTSSNEFVRGWGFKTIRISF